MSIDELVATRGPQAIAPLAEFVGINSGYRFRRYYKARINAERANQGRWRRGVSERRAADIDRRYAEALDRLEADALTAAPLLRRSLERSRAADPASVAPIPYLTPAERARVA